MTATITQFPQAHPTEPAVVALCGGTSGARFANGLYSVLRPGALTVIVNTASDFQHLGLNIAPDLDAVLYTLGGCVKAGAGWGCTGETWNFMDALGELGGEAWLTLGDRELAMHVLRTHWLQWGKTPSAFAAHAASRFGISAHIIPMTNDMVSTWVSTGGGLMPFQQYGMKERCLPVVSNIHFEGVGEARPAPEVLAALRGEGLKAIVIGPSTPYLSIDPILSVPGIRSAIEAAKCPVIAVSPLATCEVTGCSPAKIMTELGYPASWQTIARHYGGLIDGLVIDEDAAPAGPESTLAIETVPVRLDTLDEQQALAKAVLAFAARLEVART